MAASYIVYMRGVSADLFNRVGACVCVCVCVREVSADILNVYFSGSSSFARYIRKIDVDVFFIRWMVLKFCIIR